MEKISLNEDEAREVRINQDLVLEISSEVRDDYNKKYDNFVYEDHDGAAFLFLRKIKAMIDAFLFDIKFGRVNKEPGNILDIGCSTGLFLKYLSRRWNKHGVEVNNRAVEIAKEKNGLVNVYESSFEHFNTELKFDIIRANHVLEHIKNYDIFFSKIYSMMNDGGILIIETPNYNSFSFWLFKKNWDGFHDRTHYNIFSIRSFKVLCVKYNLNIISYRTNYCCYFGGSILRLFNINNNFLSLVIYFSLYLIYFPISLIELLLNMGDSVSVVLEKKL